MSNTDQTTLAMALHCHQPVGNFPEVFQQITEESYHPFLEHYQRFEEAGSIGFHASGPLLNWWSNNQPAMIDLIGQLVDEGRLELITAGFYEPILSLIPRDDRRRQVEKHLDLLETLFETRPNGLWLTERIWQPDLPEDLAPLGIDYTIVDDFHFTCAGWERDELSGYYTTESNGRTLDIFPISQELRYRIPFYDVDEITEYLDNAPHGTMTMADDGEKFGSWPDTREWVYEDGWLERFLGACTDGDIQLQSLGEAHDENESNGRCYLPTASYQEMLEWALPADTHREYQDWKQSNPDDAEKHGRGGFFQHFLVKYEESNRLHKRMQWLSKRIDKENNSEATDNLLAGQCNDTYWHGVFGGLFLPHLRSTAWNRLSEAYASGDCATGEPVEQDFGRDGRTEVVYGDDTQFLVIDPYQGGEVSIWELFEPGRNILDSLSRRWESYLTEADEDEHDSDGEVDTIHHRKTEVPAEWLESWAEDPVARAGFQPVHFPDGEISPDELRRNNGVEYLLRNTKPASVRVEDKSVRLRYHDGLNRIDYHLGENEFQWSGETASDFDGTWGLITTLGIRSPFKDDSQVFVGEDTHAVTDHIDVETTSIGFVDGVANLHLTLSSSNPVSAITYPVNTISRSEEDAERIYQGTAVVIATDRNQMELDASWSTVEET